MHDCHQWWTKHSPETFSNIILFQGFGICTGSEVRAQNPMASCSQFGVQVVVSPLLTVVPVHKTKLVSRVCKMAVKPLGMTPQDVDAFAIHMSHYCITHEKASNRPS